MKFMLASIFAYCTAGFSVTPKLTQRVVPDNKALFYYPDESFIRAIKCAGNTGMCDVDELIKLADELEDFQGCFFEENQEEELCNKEIQDRKDVADTLRLQAELHLKQDYLKEANLFADSVKSEHDVLDREEFVENVLPGLDV
mmetsp:Transcript_2210/g.2664  ORF Transcript_2210/g.2664 Transcript_2210/m.2664 type:complete len:143 (-) Transcript_2210:818-1246(-)|eukprot:CAMPEP_0195251968 /NCGR_PEP_ID=MMETSP0706-20130129/3594_1 /TAXON_ID=33640 /ORGANISM="Asterionellopsis glacialis, Strain CCMP134" /LENGTH=142 /DNA_ID=CAMNT_0040304197 /DNA_START=100 /DNA_END=528 /DNA_ORIENTATION=+